MRTFYFTRLLKSSIIWKGAKSISTRLHSKTIIGDKITPLTEHTLLGRMLLYLNNEVHKPAVQYNGIKAIDSLVHGKTSLLRNLNVDQITDLFYSINISRKEKLRKVLELLDIECCLRINGMNMQHKLKVLNAFMHVIPNRITEFKFYKYTMENIDRCLKDISKQELLQFIFYIGLEKKIKQSQIALTKCLRHIDKDFLDTLTVEDLCIICNSTFRTHTKIKNESMLAKIKDTLNNNLYLLKDPALLVTMIKTIKYNHYEDEDLLSTLSCTIFFNNTSQYYTFTANSHILSLFADYLYYDGELLALLFERNIEHLQKSSVKPRNTYFSEQIRSKDITTFLWSLSVLGYSEFDQNIFEELIEPKIMERVANGEYKNHPEELVDCILYMWILNYHARKLIPYALKPENIPSITDQPKSRLRLNLLLKSIEYEDPNLFNNLKLKPIGTWNFDPTLQIDNRPYLQKVFKALTHLGSDFQMNCQIPYLNMVGISGYVNAIKKAVNVEVLDEYSCVKNIECHTSGFMKLKLRILDELKVPLIVIEQNEIESMTDLELQNFLEDEIKLKC